MIFAIEAEKRDVSASNVQLNYRLMSQTCVKCYDGAQIQEINLYCAQELGVFEMYINM